MGQIPREKFVLTSELQVPQFHENHIFSQAVILYEGSHIPFLQQSNTIRIWHLTYSTYRSFVSNVTNVWLLGWVVENK